jgi:hypothetical protein
VATNITGTNASDFIEQADPGDFIVQGLGGNDFIAVRRQPNQTGNVSVQLAPATTI